MKAELTKLVEAREIGKAQGTAMALLVGSRSLLHVLEGPACPAGRLSRQARWTSPPLARHGKVRRANMAGKFGLDGKGGASKSSSIHRIVD